MKRASQRDLDLFGGDPTDGSVDISRFVIPPERIQHALATQFRGQPRYLVLHESPQMNHTTLHGRLSGPTLFRTLRNAIREAVGESAWWAQHPGHAGAANRVGHRGLVIQFDLTRMPVIDLTAPHAFVFKEDSELEFAERQVEHWARRVQALHAQARQLPPEPTPPSPLQDKDPAR